MAYHEQNFLTLLSNGISHDNWDGRSRTYSDSSNDLQFEIADEIIQEDYRAQLSLNCLYADYPSPHVEEWGYPPYTPSPDYTPHPYYDAPYCMLPDSTCFEEEDDVHKCHPNSRQPHHKRSRRTKGPKLREFLFQILEDSQYNPRYLKWVDEAKGIFVIVESKKVAQLWGRKKQKKNMTFEYMSRAIRYYYKDGLMSRIPGKRLMYKFGPLEKGEHSEADIVKECPALYTWNSE